MATQIPVLPLKPSFTMAITLLENHVDELKALEEQVTDKRAERNRLIRDAREAGVPYSKLMRATGLSRDTLYEIALSPERPTGQKAY